VRAITLETGSLTSTFVHELDSVGRDSREGGALDVPFIRLSRALGRLAVLPEATVAARVSSRLVSLGKTLKVRVGLNVAVAADLDKTVTVGLDSVLVDETTRVDTRHVSSTKPQSHPSCAGW